MSKSSKAKYYVTAQMLIDNGACSYQVERFREVFGDRADVTRENVQRALDANLPVAWPASKLWITNHNNSIERRAGKLELAIYRDDNDADKVLRLLNRVGKLWAEHKASRPRRA